MKAHGLVTPVRRSSRLNALSSSKDEIQSPDAVNLEEKDDSKSKTVERFGEKCDYESIRNARISENMARMESLGLLHAARGLNQIISSSPKSNKMKSLEVKKEHGLVTPVRRSSRLNAFSSSKDEIQSPDAINLEEKDDSKSKTVERFGEKCDYESIRNARISENMARIESLGLLHAARGLDQIISSSPKSDKMKSLEVKKEHGLVTPVRRSSRLNALSSSKDEIQSPDAINLEEKDDSKSKTVERFGEKCDYESIRNARISQNMARMESLGLLHAARELNQIISSSPKSNKTNKPKWKDRKLDLTPTRRSSRLQAINSNKSEARSPCAIDFKEKEVVFEPDKRARIARRCESKGRGSVYDPILGICCHFCRQKKLCGEENCKRCGDGDPNLPCIGKTECSACHSTNGILCRACLQVRYGEEMEDVRRNKDWMCPHCVEEKGINPFWICNSSFCMKKRKLVPTGIAIYEARAKGYKSVAHLLMDQLKKKASVQSEKVAC